MDKLVGLQKKDPKSKKFKGSPERDERYYRHYLKRHVLTKEKNLSTGEFKMRSESSIARELGISRQLLHQIVQRMSAKERNNGHDANAEKAGE